MEDLNQENGIDAINVELKDLFIKDSTDSAYEACKNFDCFQKL